MAEKKERNILGSGIYVRWKNFRSFADTKSVCIKPLTILLGANNSGKSSFIAPFLLLKETLERDSVLALQTFGGEANLGAFVELIRNHDAKLPVSFDLAFHTHKHLPTHDPHSHDASDPGRLVVEFKENLDNGGVDLESYTVYDTEDRKLLSRRRLRGLRYSLRGLNKTVAGSKSPRFDKRFDAQVRRHIAKAFPRTFLFTDAPFGEAIREIRLTDSPGALSSFCTAYLSIVESVSDSVSDLFDRTHFVGPLREKPRRLYANTGVLPDSVGAEGQHMAEMIFRWADATDEYTKEIEKWLRVFEFDVRLIPRSVTTEAFSLRIKERRKGACEINLADAAFGISQLLPLIVQCVFAESFPQIIITEQPEIHLNPGLQASLADLFVSVVNSGSGILVETHSEHFILRLRRLIAEQKISPTDVGLYFVEKQDGESSIREVPIDDLGHIDGDDWPRGFFGSALDEAIGLSLAQSKRVSRDD